MLLVCLFSICAVALGTSPIRGQKFSGRSNSRPPPPPPPPTRKQPPVKQVKVTRYLDSPGPPLTKDAKTIPAWLHFNMFCPGGTYPKSNSYCQTNRDCGGGVRCHKDFGEIEFPPLPKGAPKEFVQLILEDKNLFAKYQRLPIHKKYGLCCAKNVVHLVPQSCPKDYKPLSTNGSPVCGVQYDICPPFSKCSYGPRGMFGKCCVGKDFDAKKFFKKGQPGPKPGAKKNGPSF